MEEFVYSERPMTWALRLLNAPDPTGLVLDLLNLESLIEENRLKRYHMMGAPVGSIKYTTRLIPPQNGKDVHDLHVTIISGTGLVVQHDVAADGQQQHSPAGSVNRSCSNLFCVVYIQHRGAFNEKPVLVHTIETKQATTEPVWNAVCKFELPARLLSQYSAAIEVWSKGDSWGAKRTFLGRVVIPSLKGVYAVTVLKHLLSCAC